MSVETSSLASGVLHVGHRGGFGFTPCAAASFWTSWSPQRASQSCRHPAQNTCAQIVCEHLVYSTRSWQILHWNSSTTPESSDARTSARGKPMTRRASR